MNLFMQIFGRVYIAFFEAIGFSSIIYNRWCTNWLRKKFKAKFFHNPKFRLYLFLIGLLSLIIAFDMIAWMLANS